ncbi:MAG: glycosyltransferase, partial [Thermus sp.]|nr:glycosyltransferase [Thermus sp.]
MKHPKVHIVVPYAAAIPLFRKPLIRLLAEKGFSLRVWAPDWTLELREKLKGLGEARGYPMNRTGTNLAQDVVTLLTLFQAFVRERPHVVLTFQPKPNVYGILAAALAGVPRRFAVVEGLGFAFTPGEDSLKKRWIRASLRMLYKLSFALAHKVFFLNPDD